MHPYGNGDRSMATISATPSTAKQPPETLAQRFRRLATVWQDAVAYQSSTTVRNSHPAYREIVGLGTAVVPMLLRDLEDNHTHWFAALREITGADPIPESAAGNIPKMAEAWLRWAKDNNFQW
jgi:hypothetical protein